MGLLRTGLVLGGVIALLPADRSEQEALFQRASAAATWTITFCDRNGPTCETASGFWAEFKKKAEFGARLAWDTVQQNRESRPLENAVSQPPAQKIGGGALTSDDLRPDWRGKPAGNRNGI